MKKRIVISMIIINLMLGIFMTAHAATDVRHYNDELGNIFLGGNYIEVGINKNGTFGTTQAPNADWGFHFIDGQESEGYYLGLIADGDGWDIGEAPVAGDFFTPGSPEERYIFSYKIDDKIYEYIVCNEGEDDYSSIWQEAPSTKDISTGTELKASVTGVTKENVKMVITYSFGKNDLEYITNVQVENNSGKQLKDVRFVRSFDPDQDVWFNNFEYTTYNKVTSNPNSLNEGGVENFAMVVARGSVSNAGVFFLSFDNRARASRGVSFSPESAYMEGLWDKAPITEKTYTNAEDVALDMKENINGYILEDKAIAITTNFGTIDIAGKDSTEYITSLDPNVEQSLNKLAKITSQVDINKIIIDAADGQYYALYEGKTMISGWTTDEDGDGKIIFENLKSNKKYIVKTISKDDYDEVSKTTKEDAKVEETEIKTMIDPLEPEKESDPAAEITPGRTEICITGLNPNYTYQLQDAEGNVVVDYLVPVDGTISYQELKKGTKYYLVAKTDEGEVSGLVEIVTVNETGKYIDITPSNNNIGAASFKNSVEELKNMLILTEDEIQDINDGYDINVWLEVKDMKDSVSDTDKALVEGKAEDNVIAMYLDAQLFKKIGNKDKLNITELNDELTISFVVPDEYITNEKNLERVYELIRVHEGVAEIIPAEFDNNTKILTFKTSKFSTYALTYKDVPIENTDDVGTPKDNPNTGDNIVIAIIVAAIALVGLVATVIIKKIKKNKDK